MVSNRCGLILLICVIWILYVLIKWQYSISTHMPTNINRITTLREKKFSKFFTCLVFVYKSMSLKRFRIEQLCPSTDRMISLVFVHYAIL